MALVAGDVKLAQPLKTPLAGYAQKAQGGLADALGMIRNRAATSAAASGRPQGDYEGERLSQAATTAGSGIDDALYGILGQTSLHDTQSEQDFQRNVDLAKEIGDKLSPGMAEQILGGLGQGLNVGLKGKGIYDALGSVRTRTQPQPPGSYPTASDFEESAYV